MSYAEVFTKLAFILAFEIGKLALVIRWRAQRVAEWNISSNDAVIVAAKAVGLGTVASIVTAVVLSIALRDGQLHTSLGGLIGIVAFGIALRQMLPAMANRKGAVTPEDARSVALSALLTWFGLALILGVLIAIFLSKQ
jgi:hypothetical protein